MNNLAQIAHLIVVNAQQVVYHKIAQIVQQVLQLNASQSVVIKIPQPKIQTTSFVKMLQIVKKLKDTDLVISS